MRRFSNFGITTIILVFTMLCITAISALSMLSAISEYRKVEQEAERIQFYYEADIQTLEQQ